MILPNHLLKLMRPEDRARLGKAGITAEEAELAFISRNESQLQSLIQAMLERYGVYVIRQRTDRKSGLPIGCPDMLFCINGVPCAWEVKMPKQNPRPEQLEAMRLMQQNGWFTAVIHSYDEALALYRDISR